METTISDITHHFITIIHYRIFPTHPPLVMVEIVFNCSKDQGCNINNWIQRAASYNEPRLVIACRLGLAVVALKITFPRLNMQLICLYIFVYRLVIVDHGISEIPSDAISDVRYVDSKTAYNIFETNYFAN